MSRKKRMAWFKVYGSNEEALKAVDPRKGWAALLAAMGYLNREELPEDEEMDAETRIIFSLFRQSVDDAEKDYAEVSAKRTAAARSRWEKENRT